MKENVDNVVLQIGESIEHHHKLEQQAYVRMQAIARAECKVQGIAGTKENRESVFWMINGNSVGNAGFGTDITGAKMSVYSNSPKTVLANDGLTIPKNSYLGGVLTSFYSGSHTYEAKLRKGVNKINVEIFNRATWTNHSVGVRELTINLNKEEYMFNRLIDLLSFKGKKIKCIEDVKAKKEQIVGEQRRKEVEAETARKEAAEAERRAQLTKEREERQRLEEEAKTKKEEEERLLIELELKKIEEEKKQIEIENLEKEITEMNERIAKTRSFIRQDLSLRSQHLLDPYQEEAKRSHIFDGQPIIIEGGPGTGKTTTMIQRLKFLIAPEALEDYDSPLTDEQIKILTDPTLIDEHWLFFSPTEKLLQYLRSNMNEEGLRASEKNTKTLDDFRSKMMLEYKLRNPETDGPFKMYKDKKENLIQYPMSVIHDFEQFCIQNIVRILDKAYQLKTSDFKWHATAVRIKSHCAKANTLKSFEDLMNLFNSIELNEKTIAKEIENEQNEAIRLIAFDATKKIEDNSNIKEAIIQLFETWRRETISTSDLEAIDDEMDEEEDEELESVKLDFSSKLFSQLKSLIRKLALSRFDSKQKLSKRQNELYNLASPFINNNLTEVGDLAWFVKNYAFLTHGIESNLFSQIPRLYKLYRKNVLTNGDSNNYNMALLEKLVKKENNKRLHVDEQDLLIGFINNLLFATYKKSKIRFDSLKHKYANAYRLWVRNVIGVDEATDYTILDYYFIISFLHYEYSSLTICGDIMQGLNKNGIEYWGQLTDVMGKAPLVLELKTSYRQLPVLVEMSQNMYIDDQGIPAPYSSKKKKLDEEPAPLAFISDDEEEKAEWMAKRIIDVYNNYSQHLPSVAIFVGEDVNVDEFIELLNEQECLDGIKIANCTGDRISVSNDIVRVFHLSEVKGMEFEVVFFHNIDTALTGASDKILRRYLYVGISRATTHLAATFCKEGGNENILKYFDREATDWM